MNDTIRNMQRYRRPLIDQIAGELNVPIRPASTELSQSELDSLFDDVTAPVKRQPEDASHEPVKVQNAEEDFDEPAVLSEMLRSLPADGPARMGYRGADPDQAKTIRDLFAILLAVNDNAAIIRCLEIERRKGVETLYNLLYPSLFRKLISLTGQDRVEDAIQDAFRKFIATLFQPNGWKANGSVEGWILRVAQNYYKETQRDRTTPFTDFTRADDSDDGESVSQFEERVSVSEGDILTFQGRSSDFESLMTLDEMIDFKQALARVLPTFDNDQRLVLSLVMEGYDIPDIANVTRLTSYRVGLIWRDITTQLREAINGNPITLCSSRRIEEDEVDDDAAEDGHDI